MQEGVAKEAQICLAVKSQSGLLDHEPTGCVTLCHLQLVLLGDDPDEKQNQSGRHQVQGGAANGLVSPQIHGGKGQKQGEDGTQQGGDQHCHHFQPLKGEPVIGCFGSLHKGGALHGPDKKHAHKGTEDHNTFQRQVDDTASLRENTGKGNDHQRHSIQ